jgi:hypothetical protein
MILKDGSEAEAGMFLKGKYGDIYFVLNCDFGLTNVLAVGWDCHGSLTYKIEGSYIIDFSHPANFSKTECRDTRGLMSGIEAKTKKLQALKEALEAQNE